ncbi:Hint domain-containing protein [Roseovarius amoyensis]|uniref:Hint domain-containing protein n=1 Tax=Roseovarius amoyensis TaxID=2211448 RepID=UPI000DBE3825|nr:Hint domain-containing protein [Roseovarius amoyensis]
MPRRSENSGIDHADVAQAATAARLCPGQRAVERAINCFTPGTLITTRAGKCPVEKLRPGDKLLTRDHGFQPLLWCGMRRADPSHAGPGAWPVLIRAGALGPGQPERDMIVSPGHRLLSTDPDFVRATGEPEALIAAQALTARLGIQRIMPEPTVYLHLLLDRHEVILAENSWTESFRLSRSALHIMAAAGREHLARILPQQREWAADAGQVAVQAPARLCPAADTGAGGLGDQGRNRPEIRPDHLREIRHAMVF